ncbi:hypothetical protein GCM10022399_00760 [Terrabacter ginsenosidimutans]|jgi:hypothetical protein|uniref:DUF4178 domain-containing protein n=1 Tax=Terrabacter ginsenosidimutans TaxID=490575 RepID=A0ABP7CI12_9MICO
MRAELRASQIAPGAVLKLEGELRRVVGSLHFVMDGRQWTEHCVESAPGPHEWLSIRPHGGTTLVHWTPRYDLFGEPATGGVTMDGRDWVFADSGHATYTATGDTGTGSQGSCDYVEYVEADGADGAGDLLVFESFDGGVWEVSVGRHLDPALVRGYRASGA